jgi:hypothetical protein
MKRFLGRKDQLIRFRIEWNCGQVAAFREAFGDANAFTKTGWQEKPGNAGQVRTPRTETGPAPPGSSSQAGGDLKVAALSNLNGVA